MKNWLQDNFRIIVSILIVLLIAGGIYSYSKRTDNGMTQKVADQKSADELALVNEESPDNNAVIEEGSEETNVNQESEKEQPSTQAEETKNVPPKEEAKTSSASTSQETEQSFVETAGKGDGVTHLARRSLANYLEKNPDSSLTAEHKIYVEDYLRKNVGFRGGVNVGSTIEFQKNLIQEGVAKAKTLNESQLNNLKKYSARVPSLS